MIVAALVFTLMAVVFGLGGADRIDVDSRPAAWFWAIANGLLAAGSWAAVLG